MLYTTKSHAVDSIILFLYNPKLTVNLQKQNLQLLTILMSFVILV